MPLSRAAPPRASALLRATAPPPTSRLRPLIGLVAGACMSLGLAAPGPAHAQAPTEAYARLYRWQPPPQPPAAGSFVHPAGIAVASDGRVLVADSGLHAIHVLAPDGVPIRLYGEPGGRPRLGSPRDVAVAADGRLVASDPDGRRLLALDPATGEIVAEWAFPGVPGALATWRAGVVAINDSTRGLTFIGPDGGVMADWPPIDALEAPVGIAVDPADRIFVADAAAKAILVFDEAGNLVDGMRVQGDGVAATPLAVAADKSGDVFVQTELALFRLRDGRVIGPPLDNPGGRDLALGPGSGLVAAVIDDRLGFRGVRHMPDRRAISPDLEAWGNPFAELGSLERTRRISANADGRLFLVDRSPRVQTWRDGTPAFQFQAGLQHDIAAGLRGSVFGITGHAMTYWTEAGDLLWTWQPPSTDPVLENPYGWLTVVDGDGPQVGVVDMADQRFHGLDFSGNTLAEWRLTGDENAFASVSDMAVAGTRAFLLNRSRRSIEVRDRQTGALQEAFTLDGRPVRIDALSEGAVLAALQEGWIEKLDQRGNLVAAWPVASPPRDVAAGPAGQALVAFDDAVEVWGPDPAGVPQQPPPFATRCTLEPAKTAAPAEVGIGSAIEVRLSIDGSCPLADARSDIMLLVDTSGSMSGPKMAAARGAALEFVGGLDYSLNKIGLITFSTDVDIVQTLTDNPRSLIRAIPDLGDDAGTNMLGAVSLGLSELHGPRHRPEAREVVILLTDGRPSGGYAEILGMARRAREEGIDIFTVGLGADVDAGFLKLIATRESFYFESPTPFDLQDVYDAIGRRVETASLVARATVTDTLPANMAYVDRSASPPAIWEAGTRSLTWTVSNVGSGGLELRYLVRPAEAGHWPTNVAARADVIDGVGAAATLDFPVPYVDVREPVWQHAYLPLALDGTCPEARIDAALVFDTSVSMREPQPAGATKLEAAVSAARALVAAMNLPADRVAIAAFSDTGMVVEPLTADEVAIAAALGRLPAGSGTRLDQGLDAGVHALGIDADHPAPRGRVAALVLLTDGQHSGSPEADVLARAQAARDASVVVYAIGLGADVDAGLLEAIAADPRRLHLAPTAAELGGVYREIAGLLPCR